MGCGSVGFLVHCSTALGESAKLSTQDFAHLDRVFAGVSEISACLLISEAIEGLRHELASDAALLAVLPHEYELFRDPETFGQGPGRLRLRPRFKGVRRLRGASRKRIFDILRG